MFLFDFRRTGGRARYLILGNRSGPEENIIAAYVYHIYNVYIGTYLPTYYGARLYIYNKRHGERRYKKSGMRGAGLVRSQPPHRGDTRSTVINISRTPHVN